ncbi:hypothetical protein ACFLRZ_02960 [Bacteroidota bacterium]
MKKLILGLAAICFILFSVIAIQSNLKASSETKIVAAKEIPNFDKDKDKDKDKNKNKSKKSKCNDDCVKSCCDNKGKTDKSCTTKTSSECCSKSKSSSDKDKN